MAQVVAIGNVVAAFSSVSLEFGIVLGGSVVVVYYAAGGLWSSAIVNAVQLVVKLVAFPLALLAASRVLGGFDALRATAATVGDGYLSPMSVGWLGIVGYLGVLGTSFVISPGIVQKTFGARDAATVRKGLLISAAGLLAFAFIPLALGMLARVQWPLPIIPFEDGTGWVLPQLLVQVLPPAIGILALAAVVSAELSSADAVLFMLSTSMSRDFYQRFWNPGVDDRGLLRAGRISAVIGLVASVALALVYPSILGGLSTFYGLLVVALAIPMVAGLYWRRAGNTAVLASVITSLALALGALWWTQAPPGPANLWPSVLGIAAGAVVCIAVTLLRPARPDVSTGREASGREGV